MKKIKTVFFFFIFLTSFQTHANNRNENRNKNLETKFSQVFLANTFFQNVQDFFGHPKKGEHSKAEAATLAFISGSAFAYLIQDTFYTFLSKRFPRYKNSVRFLTTISSYSAIAAGTSSSFFLFDKKSSQKNSNFNHVTKTKLVFKKIFPQKIYETLELQFEKSLKSLEIAFNTWPLSKKKAYLKKYSKT